MLADSCDHGQRQEPDEHDAHLKETERVHRDGEVSDGDAGLDRGAVRVCHEPDEVERLALRREQRGHDFNVQRVRVYEVL